MAFDAIKSHIINAVAAAAFLGGGSTLIALKVSDARQDERMVAMQQAVEALPEIRRDVQETKEAVVRLEAKLGADSVSRN